MNQFPTSLTAIVYIVIGFAILQGLTWIARRYFKLDGNERELILQAKVGSLEKQVADQIVEIENLRNQVKIIVQQYQETLTKYARLSETCEALTVENEKLSREVANLADSKIIPSDKILFVVIGSEDSSLTLDLASIRAVKMETGFEVKEMVAPTPGVLKRELERARGRKVKIYMHMAVFSDKQGYQLGTQVVDVNWLSSILQDVIVLVVAGADSSYVGEFLGVVPYVVTVDGGVPSRELSTFVRLFWSEIGNGIGPGRALKRAVDKAAPEIKEKIVKHWED